MSSRRATGKASSDRPMSYASRKPRGSSTPSWIASERSESWTRLCGSGNFLYVTLRMLKDLEKEILVECRHRGLKEFELSVGPHQLFGIEINPYAFDLAQMTVWIGFIQWQKDNGFPIEHEPILQALHNFELKDAVLDLSNPDIPKEPSWPDASFIVGNPPFLGDKKMRGKLGDDYVDKLKELLR